MIGYLSFLFLQKIILIFLLFNNFIGRFLSTVSSKGYFSAVAAISLSGQKSQTLKFALYAVSKGK